MVDCFVGHRSPIIAQHFQRLGIGRRDHLTDSKKEPSLKQVIGPSDVRRDHERVAERQIMHASAELDRLGSVSQRSDEMQRVGYVLALGRHMFADEGFGISEPIRQPEYLTIFFQHVSECPSRRMVWLREKTEVHSVCTSSRSASCYHHRGRTMLLQGSTKK